MSIHAEFPIAPDIQQACMDVLSPHPWYSTVGSDFWKLADLEQFTTVPQQPQTVLIHTYDAVTRVLSQTPDALGQLVLHATTAYTANLPQAPHIIIAGDHRDERDWTPICRIYRNALQQLLARNNIQPLSITTEADLQRPGAHDSVGEIYYLLQNLQTGQRAVTISAGAHRPYIDAIVKALGINGLITPISAESALIRYNPQYFLGHVLTQALEHNGKYYDYFAKSRGLHLGMQQRLQILQMTEIFTGKYGQQAVLEAIKLASTKAPALKRLINRTQTGN